MRAKSETNSHKFVDEKLRHTYKDWNVFCELTWWLKRNCPGEVDPHDPSGDVHHIFELGGRRDLISNLIVISRSVHDWIHFKRPADGRILCLWRKRFKGELLPDEVLCASGKTLEGVLVCNTPKLLPIRNLRDQMLGEI